jgi:hypothetical protein
MEPIIMSRNILSKGINTNIYPSRLPADFCFELVNGKVYSTEQGNGYVLQNLKGNREFFNISDGFSIIGLKEWNNILYIVSANENNKVEIGSYPSPKQMIFMYEGGQNRKYRIDDTLTGLEDVYKPLPCIYGGMGSTADTPPVYYNTVHGMRTEMFKFDVNNILYPLVKSANDNTINIYLFDGNNPNRTINSCFNDNGEIIIDRLYRGSGLSYNEIEYAVDRITRQFLSISKPPYARLLSVEEGGQLPLGNIFVYIRYLDYDFNKTNFVPLIGPVLISNGEDIFTVSGNNPDGNINKSNKRMVIDVNYIDMSYKYFEIAIAWKTSNDNVALGERAMLISNRIPIIVDNEIEFIITGMEEMSEISIQEIIRPALKETSCLAATSLSNRFWGANWKESNYDKTAMKELAKRIYVEPELKKKDYIRDLHGNEMKDCSTYTIDKSHPSEINYKIWYQSPEYVLDRVGYYRGEVYPFALVGILDDGTYTDPFPITGFDYYNAYELEDNLVTINDEDYLSDDDNTNNGFVRFPQFGTGKVTELTQEKEETHIDDLNYILLAKTQLTHFWNYLNLPENINKFNNISGFKVVRADRFKNLLYHGINLPTGDVIDVPEDNEENNSWLPFTDTSVVEKSLRFGGGQNREDIYIGSKNALSFPCVDSYPKIKRGNSNPSFPYIREPKTLGDTDIGYSMVKNAIDGRKAIYAPDYLLSNYNKFVDNQNLYYYIPYSQLPHYGENWDSRIYGKTYYYGSDMLTLAEEQLSNSMYQYVFNYRNDVKGLVSLEGKLLKGYSWQGWLDTGAFNVSDKYGTYHYCYLEYFRNNWGFDEGILSTLAQKFTECQNGPIRIGGLYDSWDISNNDNHYLKVVGTNVPYGVHRNKNNYSSMFGDGILSSLNIGYIYNSADHRNMGNRDISSLKYIGIDYNDETAINDSSKIYSYYDSSMMPILIYNQPNNNSYYTELVDRYKKNGVVQLFGIEYRDNTLFIDKNRNARTWFFNERDAEGNNLTEYHFYYIYVNGDCFVSRFNFRQSFNIKTYDLYIDDDGNPITGNNTDNHYNHGRLFSVVLQSNSNTGVRANVNNGFYPLWSTTGWKIYDTSSSPIIDYWKYQISRNSILSARFGGSNLGLGPEDLIYDWGYSETLPFNIIPGINEIYKDEEKNYETRVRYTDKSFEEAYIDGWRSMYYLSKSDFSIEFGKINIIGYHSNNLIIVQDNAICELYPNEKYITQTENNSSSEAIVGVGSILPNEYKKLADFGSQHISFIQTSNYLSAYDFKKSIWWKSGLTSSGVNVILSIIPISTNINKFLIDKRKEIIDPKIVMGIDIDESDLFLTVKAMVRKSFPVQIINNQTYITIEEDNLYDINGYITIYEYTHNGYMYQSYNIYDMYRDTIIIDQDLTNQIVQGEIHLYINLGYTIQNHENLSSTENQFLSKTGFSPDIYGSFKNMLISNNRTFDDMTIWLHDNIEERCLYYGMDSWFKYGIVISGVTEGQTFNQMIFGSIITISDEIPFSYIDYETEFQYTRHMPFYNEEMFWITPEYKENKWDFTVPTCITGKSAGYDTDSNMRGIWMKTMFVYKGHEHKFIGDVISKNIISNS